MLECAGILQAAAAAAPRAEFEEELYDEAAVIPAAAAADDDDDDDELYQEAGDTRTYTQPADSSQGICARALYDYQAGRFSDSYSFH